MRDNPIHILLHVRKKEEGSAVTKDDYFYDKIIKYCNEMGVQVIIIGGDNHGLFGNYYDWAGMDIFSFEGMGYLITKSKIMIGNDSGFSAIKLYQQQKNKLLIMEHPRWERSNWYFRVLGYKPNCLLLDARKDNIEAIKKTIGGYYGTS